MFLRWHSAELCESLVWRVQVSRVTKLTGRIIQLCSDSDVRCNFALTFANKSGSNYLWASESVPSPPPPLFFFFLIQWIKISEVVKIQQSDFWVSALWKVTFCTENVNCNNHWTLLVFKQVRAADLYLYTQLRERSLFSFFSGFSFGKSVGVTLC